MEEANALLTKSRGLSQRVATFCNRLIGESDALAGEVSVQQAWRLHGTPAQSSSALQIKGLQQATSAAESAARKHPEPQLAGEVCHVTPTGLSLACSPSSAAWQVLAVLRSAKDVLHGLGPGGDL